MPLAETQKLLTVQRIVQGGPAKVRPTYIFDGNIRMHSSVTIKNVSWPHFSWPTLYDTFLSAACSATAPAAWLAAAKYESATVVHADRDIPSQWFTSAPSNEGAAVRALSSLRARPAGCFFTGMPATLKAWLTHSFRAWCLNTRLGACLRPKPCVPVASTALPHWQEWELPSSEP